MNYSTTLNQEIEKEDIEKAFLHLFIKLNP